MKPFYVHIIPEQFINKKHLKYSGATLWFTEKDENEVFAYVTLCSKKDQFQRKLGRENVTKNDPVVIHKRQVAKFAALVDCKVFGQPEEYADEISYMYLLKNVL